MTTQATASQPLEITAEQDAEAQSPALVEAVLSASRVLVAVAAQSLANVAEEVTLPQYRVLVLLASRGPQRVLSLAESLAVTPSTATRMCDRLVKKGLVRRRAARSDRREVRITLAPAGKELVDDVTRRRREQIRNLLDSISSADQAMLVELCNKISAAGGEPPDREWFADWDL